MNWPARWPVRRAASKCWPATSPCPKCGKRLSIARPAPSAGSICWSTMPAAARWDVLTEASPDRLRQVMELNFFAPAELTRAALPLLKAGRKPMVVNVGSILGHRGIPGCAEYCASKFALQGLSESLRAEFAPLGIDLLVVSPARTQTEFFQQAIDAGETPWSRIRGVSPEVVARRTVTAIRRGRHEIVISPSGKLVVWMNRLVPRVMDGDFGPLRLRFLLKMRGRGTRGRCAWFPNRSGHSLQWLATWVFGLFRQFPPADRHRDRIDSLGRSECDDTCLGWLILFGWILAGEMAWAQSDSLAPLLKTIRDVGPEGKGNLAASTGLGRIGGSLGRRSIADDFGGHRRRQPAGCQLAPLRGRYGGRAARASRRQAADRGAGKVSSRAAARRACAATSL